MTGIRVALLSSNRHSQEKKYYDITWYDNNSSHWNKNKNNSPVMIDNHQRQNEIKKLKNQIKHQDRIRVVGTEIVIDLK